MRHHHPSEALAPDVVPVTRSTAASIDTRADLTWFGPDVPPAAADLPSGILAQLVSSSTPSE